MGFLEDHCSMGYSYRSCGCCRSAAAPMAAALLDHAPLRLLPVAAALVAATPVTAATVVATPSGASM